MSSESIGALSVGKQLADLCSQGKNLEAINSLYANDIVSVEAVDMGNPDMPQTMTGIDAIRGKNEWWFGNHEIHNSSVSGPFPHGDRFVLCFEFDVTPKVGAMAGKRIQMQEAALYTVSDGKITKEAFFYHMGE